MRFYQQMHKNALSAGVPLEELIAPQIPSWIMRPISKGKKSGATSMEMGREREKGGKVKTH